MTQIMTPKWHVYKSGYVCEDRIELAKPRSDLELWVLASGATDVQRKHAYYQQYAKAGTLPCLCPLSASDLGNKSAYRMYDPMKKPDLFRQFACLDEAPETVLRFANENGLLGLEHSPVEPLEHWYAEIRELKRVVTLHGLVDDPSGVDHTAELQDRYGMPGVNASRMVLSVTPMWDVVEVVNAKLNGRVSLRLVMPGNALDLIRNYGFPAGMTLAPQSLLGALWLQFALQMYGMRRSAVCQHCGKTFWLKSSEDEHRERNQRRTSMYCSGACKTAHCRKRKNAVQNYSQMGQ